MNLRIVAFDHFYGQDLDALEASLGDGDSLVRIDYRRLHQIASRLFSSSAFVGLANAYLPSEDPAWKSYVPIAESFAHRLLEAYQPNLFVVPTDSIFYLRPVISCFQSEGVVCVVVQKETTISPMVMEAHSREVGECTPFMSDWMTVCSDRHREFWILSGAQPERILVTGQPRFDTYAATRPSSSSKKQLLYLSFDDVAYLPADRGWSSTDTWREFRAEVEGVLAVASTLGYSVSAKRHPQQGDQGDWLGEEVTWWSPAADTRTLIANADVVVGFQTTGLFEAMAAQKCVVYPGWGEVFHRNSANLIPFHHYDGALLHATSPAHLLEILRSSETRMDFELREEVVREHLGPVDGSASWRVVCLLRQWAKESEEHPVMTHVGLVTVIRLRISRVALGLLARFSARLRERANAWRSIREQELTEAKMLRARSVATN